MVGYFANCLHATGYDGSDASRNMNTVFVNNSLYRCLTADNYFPAEDHGIYVCGFKNCRIENNYIYGWDTEPQGHGIKARNGEDLDILDNVIDRSGILLYIYDDIAYRDLKNVLVRGNEINIWDPYDGDISHNGIHYWKTDPNGTEISIRVESNRVQNGAINFSEPADHINVTTFNQNGGGVFENTASHIELKTGINSSRNIIQ